MKRHLLILCAVWFCLSVLTAAPRSAEEAHQAAIQYFQSHSTAHRLPMSPVSVRPAWTVHQSNGAPAFYVFNRGEDGGFVLISAEDRTHTVIGYSDTGHFDPSVLPANARAWFEGYARTIEHLSSQPELPASVRRSPSRHHDGSGKRYTPVAPLCTTQWGQGSPYNNLCPTDAGGRSVTGCVATAAAQIMKKYNYPTKGSGSHSYQWTDKDGNSRTLSANFGNTTYQWNSMKDNYRATGSTSAQKQAVATLMYHCGVACDMEYSSEESGANAFTMLQAMVEHFGYDAGIRTNLLNYMKNDDFIGAIADDLSQGHPVYFSGRTKKDEGHAFVCDGIDEDGLVHINWGWDGQPDAYYHVWLLDPEYQGIGGSSSNDAFTEYVSAYTGIRPDEGGTPQYFFSGERVTFENKRFRRSDPLYFQIDTFCNQSFQTWEGAFGFQLYKNGSLYRTYTIENELTLDPGWYYGYVYMTQYLSGIATGEYEFVPFVTTSSDDTRIPVHIHHIGAYRCRMSVTSDSIFLDEPEQKQTEEEDIFDPTPYSYTSLSNYHYKAEDDGGTSWRLQLATEDFYSEDAEDQVCILFAVQGAHDESVSGSYIPDGDSQTLCYGASLYIGNISSYTRLVAGSAECTVLPDREAGTYKFYYSLTLGGKLFTGVSTIRGERVKAYSVENDQYTDVVLQDSLYSALSPTQAESIARSLASNYNTPIPYAVSGKISQLANTPEQIKQYGNCRLYLSDGSTSLYSHNTKWLNGSAFSTGDEIAVNGKAVIAGPLCHYNGTTPEINSGYICHYTAPEEDSADHTYDSEEDDFIVDFESYEPDYQYLESHHTIIVRALRIEGSGTQQDSLSIQIEFIVPAGSDHLVPGRYTIAGTGEGYTIFPGYIEDNLIYGSWAAYLNGEGQLYIPLWYLVSGRAEVSSSGRIDVDATNSHGRIIRCTLHPEEVIPSEDTEHPRVEEAAQKILRDGQLIIVRDGVLYTVTGTRL